MKKKLKIVIPIIIVLIIIILLLVLLPKTAKDSGSEQINNNIQTKEEAKAAVEQLNRIIINGGTKEDLEKALGNDKIQLTDIMTGPDSYLRINPSKKLKDKYKLNDYIKTADKAADNLDKQIKENFTCDIKDPITSKKLVSVAVSYKSYYYQAYLRDLHTLQNQLLIKAGYKLDENTKITTKMQADMYKSKVKAIVILDKHLDNYKNTNETKVVGINYKKGQISQSSNELTSYLMNLNGYNYDIVNQNSEFMKNTGSRIAEYLKEIDPENPLDL